MMNMHCQEIIKALRLVGFSDRQIQDITEERNRYLLREMLVGLLAEEEQDVSLVPHMNESVLTAPFKPAPLSPCEWGEFFDRKNRSSAGACVVKEGDLFFKGSWFEEEISTKDPSFLLVNSQAGKGSLNSIIDLAEGQMQGCFYSTKPRLIFEILRKFWGRLNDINAAFIAVPIIMPKNGKFPVIMNSCGVKTLKFAQTMPPNTVSGYFAFCGDSLETCAS